MHPCDRPNTSGEGRVGQIILIQVGGGGKVSVNKV